MQLCVCELERIRSVCEFVNLVLLVRGAFYLGLWLNHFSNYMKCVGYITSF
jgi:hypothetical protein